MACEPNLSRPLMQGPAVYQIHVRGRLLPAWSRRVEGMACTESRGADGEAETILTGRLADQAALIGVINTLYNLHLPIISVTCLGDDQEHGAGEPPGPMQES